MYHFIETGLTVSVLYLISFIFYKAGFYSLGFHKKFWNSVLALAFLFTALAGVFMALQIRYKWDIPVIKTFLKWHVEVGIVLAFTGIFHFLWHLSYFRKLIVRADNLSVSSDYPLMTSSEIISNLFVVGFTSTSVQLLLIREMMNISGGYELITGTFLGSWLIASAIGAAIAGKSILNDIKKINLFFFVSSFISLLLLILLSKLFLETGETPSFLASLIYTFLVLLPFCLVSGFTFVKLISAARTGYDFKPGKSFSIETLGGIIAGIFVSVIASGWLNTYQLLLLIILLFFSYTILTFFIKKQNLKFILKILVLFLASFIIVTNPDNLFRQLLLPGVKVTGTEDTPYGNITHGEYAGEKSIYYNQRLINYSDDVTEREEDIHYALLQKRNPEKVLLISGSIKSHLPEILKYPVKKVIFIERDPALVKSEIYDIDPGTVDLTVENDDAFRYIRQNKELVDAVILLLPPPSTLLINRFYTTDFFISVKNTLNPGGIFVCSPGPGETYFNKESLNLYSSIYNSLNAVFRNVTPVSGNKLYFISSDEDISVSFCRLAEERGIKNIYVSSDFLSDDLIEKKSAEVISFLDRKVRQNTSIFPVACFHFQSYYFSKNLDEKIPALVLMILAFVMPVLLVQRRNLIMYFSASSLAGFEIILLLTLQLTAGNMYQLTGLIIAGLMAGLAVGSGINLNMVTLKTKAFIILLYYTCFALTYSWLLNLKSMVPAVIVIILAGFIPALLTGNIFRELTTSKEGGISSSSTYSSDLAGSALGFILISGIATPVLGIKTSIFLLSVLIFAGFLFGTKSNK
jgi:spermidine synthase